METTAVDACAYIHARPNAEVSMTSLCMEDSASKNAWQMGGECNFTQHPDPLSAPASCCHSSAAEPSSIVQAWQGSVTQRPDRDASVTGWAGRTSSGPCSEAVDQTICRRMGQCCASAAAPAAGLGPGCIHSDSHDVAGYDSEGFADFGCACDASLSDVHWPPAGEQTRHPNFNSQKRNLPRAVCEGCDHGSDQPADEAGCAAMASEQASVAGTSAGKLADTRAIRINVARPASAAAAQRPVLHDGKVDALQEVVARPRRWSLAGSQVHSCIS